MGDSASFQPRSEVARGSRFSEVDWLGLIPTVEQQLSPTEGTDFPEDWGGKLPFYSEPTSVFGGSLSLTMGEISSGFSASFMDLLEPQYFEPQNGVLVDLTTTQGFSPSDFLVEVEQVGDTTLRLVHGLANSSTPLDISIENKKSTPTTQTGDHSNNTQHNSEGRPSKAIRCARERTGVGRLVFGEDVAMDRVLDLSERAVVGRVRGKKMGMAYLKSWVNNY
jgi:hypothetical protein